MPALTHRQRCGHLYRIFLEYLPGLFPWVSIAPGRGIYWDQPPTTGPPPCPGGSICQVVGARGQGNDAGDLSAEERDGWIGG